MKKYVDFAAMVLNLEGTIVALQSSDSEQKKSIQECIGMLTSLSAHVEAQERRLAILESCFFLSSLPASTREARVYHHDEALPGGNSLRKQKR